MSRSVERKEWEGILDPERNEEVGLDEVNEQLNFMNYAELKYPDGGSTELYDDFSEGVEEHANRFACSDVDIEYRMEIQGMSLVIEVSGREKDKRYPLFRVHATENAICADRVDGPEKDYAGT